MVAELSGATVLRATVTMPLRGAWTADVTTEGTPMLAVDTAASLRLGAARFTGTIRRLTSFAGRAGARLVGGAGRLASQLPARAYSQTPLDLPLRHALDAAGEVLDAGVDPSLLGRTLSRWTRLGAPLSHELDALASTAGPSVSWRVLDTGGVWIGEETWPIRELAAELLDDDLNVGRLRLAPDAATLRPGDMWRGRRCARVTHVWTADGLRTEAWSPLTREDPPADLHARSYLARVVTQHADGTVDLVPDSPLVPPMAGVPLRLGVPGLRVELPSDQRVRLHFDAGNPQRPFAALSDAGGTLRLGTLLVVTNTTVGAVVTVQWFEGAEGGSTLALAAMAALTPPLVGVLVPLTVGTAAVV